MKMVLKARAYMIVSWIFLAISILIGLLMVAVNIKGATYAYGVGFVNLGFAGIVCKLMTYRYEYKTFPIFYLLGMCCPLLLGFVLVEQIKSFFNIIPFFIVFVIWLLFTIIHIVHINVNKEIEEEEEVGHSGCSRKTYKPLNDKMKL